MYDKISIMKTSAKILICLAIVFYFQITYKQIRLLQDKKANTTLHTLAIIHPEQHDNSAATRVNLLLHQKRYFCKIVYNGNQLMNECKFDNAYFFQKQAQEKYVKPMLW